MKRGLLVAFEGLDGCGKSTQLKLAAERLRELGHDVLTTREPTDGSFGRRIREMARSAERVSAEQELDWFLADRAEHVEREIEPALRAGRIVLCDRYTLSSVAYQGARGEGLDPEAILREGEARFPLPDLALLFVLPVEEGLDRVRRRGGPAEPAFEDQRFLEQVEAIFASLRRPYLEALPAWGAVEEVHERVMAVLERRLF